MMNRKKQVCLIRAYFHKVYWSVCWLCPSYDIYKFGSLFCKVLNVVKKLHSRTSERL